MVKCNSMAEMSRLTVASGIIINKKQKAKK